MTTARSQQISLEATPYYHCVSRCVRRSFLCGYDATTQTNYEHRKGWVESRIKAVAKAFCIDVCAYAVMSNHYHIVLHVNRGKAQALTQQQVIERWTSFHLAPVMVQRKLRGEKLTKPELRVYQGIIETWRERLYCVSWFMRLINQFIASEANKEDSCTGHFWEGRFKSQALLDEKALAAAMAYVDLNPVRAGIAATPERSSHTSVQLRIQSLSRHRVTPPNLFPFTGYPRKNRPEGLPFRLMDYLELVDWTGRHIRKGKKGAIPNVTPPILERLGFNSHTWLNSCFNIERGQMVGSASSISTALPKFKRQRGTGVVIP
ncbi:transposase [Vibrio neptunius]|uniref:Transposase n=1 Tax=Vibrio neptunius TaxID=170651 RepID=A0ABS2ZYM5_9VIBR|nr:transposase [Vibrio neptunius]MBN3492714.1 transposase [Vibrio neptunius]MBN3515211.1 transposase [Vibrio neptunius]MBN3548913.1 transposase [Vibrio neptunius]MBN3577375.1 transposase [Vibrio neptunius]MCH9871039.1 transposase [Vibrio neptunius]